MLKRSEDNSIHLPNALLTLDTLQARADIELRVISRFSTGWDTSKSVEENIGPCGEVTWRVTDGSSDNVGGCSDAIWLEWALPFLATGEVTGGAVRLLGVILRAMEELM